MDTPSQNPPRGVSTRPWLWMILLAAVALRLWYAAAEPNSGRFFDERISLANVAAILDSGSLQPENFWYQSLSHLPQTALVGAAEQIWQWTGWQPLRMRDDDGFLPNAYRLCRALMVLWSALSLWLTFRLGRRLFSDDVALLGTCILALVPWHVIVAARFKPDGLLLLLTLLTFAWTLDVVERPNLRRYLRAGLGVGLVLATKLNGIEVVIPLIVVSLVWARRDLKVLGRLCLAGVTSIAVYWIFNPWVGATLHALQANKDIYARQAAAAEASHWGVLVQSVTSLLRPDFHGPVLGAAALAGFVLLAFYTARPGDDAGGQRLPPRLMAWALLSFPVGHGLFYAATSERFKENHQVQVVPLTSLLAAFFLLEVVRRARLRAPKGFSAGIAMLLVGALMTTMTVYTVRFVYVDVVPTTFQAVQRNLVAKLKPGTTRWICREGPAEPREAQRLRELGWAIAFHEDFRRVEASRLEACDGLIFPAARTRDEHSAFYLSRLAGSPPSRITRSEPQLFKRRGEGLILLQHNWQGLGPKEPIATTVTEGAPAASLPSCRVDARYWLEIMVPMERVADAAPWIEAARLQPGSDVGADDRTSAPELRWQWIAKRKQGHVFVSERLPCPATEQLLQLPPANALAHGKSPRLWLRRWQAPTPQPSK